MNNKIVTVIIVAIVVFGCIIGFLVIESERNHKIRLDKLKNKLREEYDVEIQKGIIKSPAVIIQLETFNEFYEKIEELKPEIIYYEYRGHGVEGSGMYYYIFTSNYNVAFELCVDAPVSKLIEEFP